VIKRSSAAISTARLDRADALEPGIRFATREAGKTFGAGVWTIVPCPIGA
jgi:hypothetical protein